MAIENYRRLPRNPVRFYLVPAATSRHKAAWLKVDDTGTVLQASASFQWAVGLEIEAVVRWCQNKDKGIRRMHGNIKDITAYL